MQLVPDLLHGMSATIPETAVGNEVVDASGKTVGIVSEVEDGTAYVNLDPHFTDRLLARLKWSHASEDDYPIDASAVAAVDGKRITLREHL